MKSLIANISKTINLKNNIKLTTITGNYISLFSIKNFSTKKNDISQINDIMNYSTITEAHKETITNALKIKMPTKPAKRKDIEAKLYDLDTKLKSFVKGEKARFELLYNCLQDIEHFDQEYDKTCKLLERPNLDKDLETFHSALFRKIFLPELLKNFDITKINLKQLSMVSKELQYHLSFLIENIICEFAKPSQLLEGAINFEMHHEFFRLLLNVKTKNSNWPALSNDYRCNELIISDLTSSRQVMQEFYNNKLEFRHNFYGLTNNLFHLVAVRDLQKNTIAIAKIDYKNSHINLNLEDIVMIGDNSLNINAEQTLEQYVYLIARNEVENNKTEINHIKDNHFISLEPLEALTGYNASDKKAKDEVFNIFKSNKILITSAETLERFFTDHAKEFGDKDGFKYLKQVIESKINSMVQENNKDISR